MPAPDHRADLEQPRKAALDAKPGAPASGSRRPHVKKNRMTTATTRRTAAPVNADEPDDWPVRIGSGACCLGLVDGGLFWAQLRTASSGPLLS